MVEQHVALVVWDGGFEENAEHSAIALQALQARVQVFDAAVDSDFLHWGGRLVAVGDRVRDELAACDLSTTMIREITPHRAAAVLADPPPERGRVEALWTAARALGMPEIVALADIEDEPERRRRYDCGFDFAADHIRWRSHELVVVAGPYGCGKSTFTQALGLKLTMSALCAERDVAAWFCTLEDDPLQQRLQIEAHMRNAVWARPSGFDVDRWTRSALGRIHVTRPEWTGERHMAWWEDRARRMHAAYGTNVFILDPWGEMESQAGRDQTETQYVRAVMRACRRLTEELDVIVIVVTHIGKDSYGRDGRIEQFRIAHAMGSVHFGGAADRGICVTRTDQLVGGGEHMVVHFDKVKIEGDRDSAGGMGVRGTLALRYEPWSHDFQLDVGATAQAEIAWRNGGKLPSAEEVENDQARKSSRGWKPKALRGPKYTGGGGD